VSSDSEKTVKNDALSRRGFMATTGAGIALASTELVSEAQAGAHAAAESPMQKMTDIPPNGFDDLRSFIAAMEERGIVMRFDRVDQDAYEGTAIVYRAMEEFGFYNSPIIIFEEVKSGGKWIKGPVLVNHLAHWFNETATLGLDPIMNEGEANYRAAMAHLTGILEKNGGNYPEIAPIEVAREDAPCKEIVVEGDDIDLNLFPFIQSNPRDGGTYVNTGSVYTKDPEMGFNFGTYRCQIQGPRQLGINSEPGQTGWRMLMAAKERGEKTAPIAIAVGQDPVMFTVASTRVPNRVLNRGPIDEHAICGGVRGAPMKVVKTDDGEFMVPAHAEMIIEGIVPLDRLEPEGPFGEVMGYMGPRKEENFIMEVQRITHRPNPWNVNSFTGMTKGYMAAPEAALSVHGFKRLIPSLVDIHLPPQALGICFVSIDKQKPGDGIDAGEKLAKIVPVAKLYVVTDKDVNLMDTDAILKAIGSRWQPAESSAMFENLRGMPLDPSMTNRPQTSKFVIDATEQWPEEGGPENYAKPNRIWLEELAPESFDLVDEKWSDKLKGVRTYT